MGFLLIVQTGGNLDAICNVIHGPVCYFVINLSSQSECLLNAVTLYGVKPFWEANTRFASKKIPRLIWKTHIRHGVHTGKSLDVIRVMWLYLTPATSLRYILMLLSYRHLGKFSKWTLPIILFYKNSLRIAAICYECYKFCSLCRLGFDFYMFISCLSQWPRSLRCGSATARLLGLWVQILPGRNGYLSLVSVVYCQIQVSAPDWSLVQRSNTKCDVSVIVKPRKWGGPAPLGTVSPIMNYISWRVHGTKLPITLFVHPPLFSSQKFSALAICMVQCDAVWNYGSSEINGHLGDPVFMKSLKCILVMLIILTWFRFKSGGCVWFWWWHWTFGVCH